MCTDTVLSNHLAAHDCKQYTLITRSASGIPMTHTPQWQGDTRALRRAGEAPAWCGITEPQAGSSIPKGCSAAVTISQNKSQEDQYLPDWLRLEAVACQAVYFSFSLYFFPFLYSFSLPSPPDNVGGASVFLILSPKIFIWRVYFVIPETISMTQRWDKPQFPHTASPDFFKACAGPTGRQQRKITGIHTDAWLLLQWSIQVCKAVCKHKSQITTMLESLCSGSIWK